MLGFGGLPSCYSSAFSSPVRSAMELDMFVTGRLGEKEKKDVWTNLTECFYHLVKVQTLSLKFFLALAVTQTCQFKN